MKIAILAMSTLSFITSAGTLVIMAKVRKDLLDGKAKVETEVQTFKQKTDRNFRRIKAVLGEMEL